MAEDAMGMIYMSQVGLSSENVVGRPILVPTALSISMYARPGTAMMSTT